MHILLLAEYVSLYMYMYVCIIVAQVHSRIYIIQKTRKKIK